MIVRCLLNALLKLSLVPFYVLCPLDQVDLLERAMGDVPQSVLENHEHHLHTLLNFKDLVWGLFLHFVNN